MKCKVYYRKPNVSITQSYEFCIVHENKWDGFGINCKLVRSTFDNELLGDGSFKNHDYIGDILLEEGFHVLYDTCDKRVEYYTDLIRQQFPEYLL